MHDRAGNQLEGNEFRSFAEKQTENEETISEISLRTIRLDKIKKEKD